MSHPPCPLSPASARYARLPLPPFAAARTQIKHTPLHHAAGNNHAEVVGLLLERGADTEARDVVSARGLCGGRRRIKRGAGAQARGWAGRGGEVGCLEVAARLAKVCRRGGVCASASASASATVCYVLHYRRM